MWSCNHTGSLPAERPFRIVWGLAPTEILPCVEHSLDPLLLMIVGIQARRRWTIRTRPSRHEVPTPNRKYALLFEPIEYLLPNWSSVTPHLHQVVTQYAIHTPDPAPVLMPAYLKPIRFTARASTCGRVKALPLLYRHPQALCRMEYEITSKYGGFRVQLDMFGSIVQIVISFVGVGVWC